MNTFQSTCQPQNTLSASLCHLALAFWVRITAGAKRILCALSYTMGTVIQNSRVSREGLNSLKVIPQISSGLVLVSERKALFQTVPSDTFALFLMGGSDWFMPWKDIWLLRECWSLTQENLILPVLLTYFSSSVHPGSQINTVTMVKLSLGTYRWRFVDLGWMLSLNQARLPQASEGVLPKDAGLSTGGVWVIRVGLIVWGQRAGKHK